MPRFEPIPVDGLPETSRAIIDAGIESGMYRDGSGLPPAPLRVMAYSSTVLRATAAQSTELWQHGLLESRLSELVRVRSAQVNGCDFCAASIKDDGVSADDVACLALPISDRLTPREAAALRVVGLMATDHNAVDETVLAELNELFSPAEVVELVYRVCVMLGQHRFHHVFRSFEPGEPVVAFAPELIDAPISAEVPS
jgi:alkylhydroperoxidase family enzyme